jgi:hypothetical protein
LLTFIGEFEILIKLQILFLKNTPKGIRIPVCSVKGSCPRPLDDGGRKFITNIYRLSGQRDSNARHQPWQGRALPLSYAR